ncbi:MAG: thioredoxin domain-containing protein [Leptospiraceae bacterium]|nr:thioredoxin domain-containing protein [Leptospiraceae bacterium]
MNESNSNSKYRWLSLAGLGIALLAALIAALIGCKHAGVCQIETGCTFNGVDGCADLGKLAASKLPGIGIPIAWLGLFYYAMISALFGWQLFVQKADAARRFYFITLLAFLVVFGAVFDLFLGYQNFVTLSPCREGWFCPKCPMCAWTYVTQIGLVIVAVWLYITASKEDEETGSMRYLLSGFVGNWLPILGALVLTVLIGVGTTMSATPAEDPETGDSDQPKIPLAPINQVDAILSELDANAKMVTFDTKGLHTYEGPANAIVTIHKYGDFLCPHCLHASEYLRFIHERWPQRVRVYYRFLPLDGACNFLAGGTNPQIAGLRCNSAKAAWCAGEQGEAVFSRYYHSIFDLQKRRVPPELDELERLAERSGANWAQIDGCMQQRAQLGIDRDLNVVKGWLDKKLLENPATPIVIVNGRLIGAGAPDFRSLVYWVDAFILKKDGAKAVADFQARHPWARAESKE